MQKYNSISDYLCQNGITAYRLIGHTIPDFPAAVEIYGTNAVIHVFDYITSEELKKLQLFLSNYLGMDGFFFKNRSRGEMNLPVSQEKKIVQEEYGNKFIINLSDEYLDTGLFLDHRETRRLIGSLSRDKTVLNTFAYSGSFSVYAARSCARCTYSVDLSGVYCDWIKENLKLNDISLDNNFIYKMDTFEFFRYARKKNLVFDIIIIDPPTFSKNKRKSFSVQKDHPLLINNALEMLSPSGFILFSTNYQDFHLNRKELNPCAVKEKIDTIPPDFAGSRPHRCYVITGK
jgi:23S rRNA (cytosine1962-C5)-methyltransferase